MGKTFKHCRPLFVGVPGVVAFCVLFFLPKAATQIRERHAAVLHADVYRKATQFRAGRERNAAEKAGATQWEIVYEYAVATPFLTRCGQSINCDPSNYSEDDSYSVVYRHLGVAHGLLDVPEHGAKITVLYERKQNGDFCRERVVGADE